MLTRKTCDNGVVVFASPLLEKAGVPHGFSTRIGGVSSGVYASLNLGNPGDAAPDARDPYVNLVQNYARLLQAARMEQRRLCRVRQVHGSEVVKVGSYDGSRTSPAAPLAAESSPPEADALVTVNREMALSVRVADCVPILIASPDGSMVAAVHAGWRGVIGGVLQCAIRAMNVLPAEIIMAIGPCIGAERFEVGEEVAQQFEHRFGTAAPVRRNGSAKPHVDLRAAVILSAISAGVCESRIDSDDLCTFRDQALFFSHRREQGNTGRLAAVIGVR